MLRWLFVGAVTMTALLPVMSGPSMAAQRALSLEDPKVRGGLPTTYAESPWQVALVNKDLSPLNGLRCGGTLIDSEWVLTAAHCLFDEPCKRVSKSSYWVAYGSVNLGDEVGLVSVEEEHIPSEYDCSKKAADIALIKLTKRAKNAGSIKLATKAESMASMKPKAEVRTSGWGRTTQDGWKSVALLEVKIPLRDNQECQSAYPNSWPGKGLCAGDIGKDACTGDSGGPLFTRTKQGGMSVTRQFGVVSYGDGCGQKDKPGVYTSVADYLDWIVKTITPKPCVPQPGPVSTC